MKKGVGELEIIHLLH